MKVKKVMGHNLTNQKEKEKKKKKEPMLIKEFKFSLKQLAHNKNLKTIWKLSLSGILERSKRKTS